MVALPERYVIGVDVGNTRLSAGLVSTTGRVVELVRAPNPRAEGAAAAIEALLELVEACLRGSEQHPAGIGIGFGGPVDHATGSIRRSHHTAGWSGIELANVFAERFGVPAFLENDANAAGLGEALFGAGRNAGSVLYVNVGTGIGGGVIVAGRVWRGAHGNAGEIGHVVVQPEGGPLCTCDKHGCVEALASGEAIGRSARELLAAEPPTPSVLRDLPSDEVTGRAVGEAARAGDALAVQVVAEAAHWLGLGLAGAANLLDPEVVIMGGGVAELGEVFLQPLDHAFRAGATPPVAENTRLLAAELGYDAGVIGAAAVVMVELGLV